MLKNKGSLKEHLLRHGNIKTHECTQCDKTFFSQKELRRHGVVHINEKTHCCTFCEKQFKRRGDLKVHQAVQHEGLKRPRGKGNRNDILCPCEICGKVFSSKGHAVRHLQMHQSNCEIFSCTFCSKTYKWQDDLKRHLWLHSEKKPHYCAVCNQGFHRKSYLNLHMKKHKLELGSNKTQPGEGSTAHSVQKSKTVGDYIKGDSDKQANVTNSSQNLNTCAQVVPHSGEVTSDVDVSESSELMTFILPENNEQEVDVDASEMEVANTVKVNSENQHQISQPVVVYILKLNNGNNFLIIQDDEDQELFASNQ